MGQLELDPAKGGGSGQAARVCPEHPAAGMLGGAASLAVGAQETSGRGCSVGWAG